MEDEYHQGAWLKRHIERLGISNAAFARRAKVSREALQRMFPHREILIRASTMWRILHAMGISSDAEAMGLLSASEAKEKNKRKDPQSEMIEEIWSAIVFSDLMRAERFGKLIFPPVAEPRSTIKTQQPIDLNVEPYSEQRVPNIPFFEMAIAAGKWTEVVEMGESGVSHAMIDGRFRIKIRGDSMEKEYPDGSVVEFRCLRFIEGFEDEPAVGEDYYVQVEENATFKRLESMDEDTFIFRALNRKKYPDKIPARRCDVVKMARAEAIVKLIPRKGR